MSVLRFSRLAEADLLNIGVYTLRTWGEAQAVRYLDELEACRQQLADHPAAGRPAMISARVSIAESKASM